MTFSSLLNYKRYEIAFWAEYSSSMLRVFYFRARLNYSPVLPVLKLCFLLVLLGCFIYFISSSDSVILSFSFMFILNYGDSATFNTGRSRGTDAGAHQLQRRCNSSSVILTARSVFELRRRTAKSQRSSTGRPSVGGACKFNSRRCLICFLSAGEEHERGEGAAAAAERRDPRTTCQTTHVVALCVCVCGPPVITSSRSHVSVIKLISHPFPLRPTRRCSVTSDRRSMPHTTYHYSSRSDSLYPEA